MPLFLHPCDGAPPSIKFKVTILLASYGHLLPQLLGVCPLGVSTPAPALWSLWTHTLPRLCLCIMTSSDPAPGADLPRQLCFLQPLPFTALSQSNVGLSFPSDLPTLPASFLFCHSPPCQIPTALPGSIQILLLALIASSC